MFLRRPVLTIFGSGPGVGILDVKLVAPVVENPACDRESSSTTEPSWIIVACFLLKESFQVPFPLEEPFNVLLNPLRRFSILASPLMDSAIVDAAVLTVRSLSSGSI